MMLNEQSNLAQTSDFISFWKTLVSRDIKLEYKHNVLVNELESKNK